MSLMLYAAMGAATVPLASGSASDPGAFIFTIRIDNDGDSFTWPDRSGTYDATFNWGDGSSDHVTAAPSAHVYAVAGDYDVTVAGVCPAPIFNLWLATRVIDVKQWGNLAGATDWSRAFDSCSNLVVSATDHFGTGVTSMRLMFSGASLANPAASSWDVSAIASATDMDYMFFGATSFDQDLSGWCVDQIDSEPPYFALLSGLQPQHYPVWGTCP